MRNNGEITMLWNVFKNCYISGREVLWSLRKKKQMAVTE